MCRRFGGRGRAAAPHLHTSTFAYTRAQCRQTNIGLSLAYRVIVLKVFVRHETPTRKANSMDTGNPANGKTALRLQLAVAAGYPVLDYRSGGIDCDQYSWSRDNTFCSPECAAEWHDDVFLANCEGPSYWRLVGATMGTCDNCGGKEEDHGY